MRKEITDIYCEITSKCNYKCIHCYNDSGKTNSYISLVKMKDLMYDMEKMGISNITFSGGEPLTYPEFDKLVKIYHDSGKKINLISNASLFYKHIDSLALVDSIQVSLDGASAFSQDFIRGKSAFDKTVSQLKNLDGEILKKITLKMVILKPNIDEIGKYIELGKSLQVGRVSFGWLCLTGRGKNIHDLNISLDEKQRVITEINSKSSIEQDIVVNHVGVTDKCPFVEAKRNEKIEFRIRIDSKGNVYPCQRIDCTEFIFGNINKSRLDEILASSQVHDFCDFAAGRQGKIKECQRCIWKTICFGGCIGNGMTENNMYSVDNDCILRKRNYKKKVLMRYEKTI